MSAFTEANRKAFDELSATYNSKPWQLTLANQVKEALQARKDWIGAEWVKPSDDGNREVKLLDFASGTGNCSNALSEYVTKIRGIDISPNMVKAYNDAAGECGAYAVEGDLFAKEGVPEHLLTPEFSEFDVAVVGLGFHHFEDPKLALERLAGRLKAVTGVLVIVDFMPFQKTHSHGATAATIKHHGFTPEEMRDAFTAAGFVDFDIVALKKPAIMEMKDGSVSERTIFVAKGRKAGSMLQRLGAWLGATQDVVGGQMRVDRVEGRWNPGVRGEGEEGERWDMVGGRKEEGWGGGQREGKVEKKQWNGF